MGMAQRSKVRHGFYGRGLCRGRVRYDSTRSPSEDNIGDRDSQTLTIGVHARYLRLDLSECLRPCCVAVFAESRCWLRTIRQQGYLFMES